MNRRRALGVLVLLATASLGTGALAEVPPMQQSMLLFRVLAYDRNLKTRAGSTVTIGVVFKPGDAASEESKNTMMAALEEAAKTSNISGMPVKAVPIAWTDAAALDAKAVSEKLAAAYVCPGLGDSLGAITGVTRRRAVMTATPSEPFVDSGLAIGLLKRGPKPTVLVNLPAARAEGTDLDAALLAVAEVKR